VSAAKPRHPWGLAALLTGAMLIGFFDRGNLAVAAPVLAPELGLSAARLGLLLSGFYWTYAAFQLVAGWLVDRTDRRWLAGASLLASASFAGLYPFLHSVWLLVGLGSAEAMAMALGGPALAAQLAHRVSGRQLGRAQGAVLTAQTGTTAVAALVAGALFELQPWLPFVAVAIGIAVAVALMAWSWQGISGRDQREPVTSEAASVPEQYEPVATTLPLTI